MKRFWIVAREGQFTSNPFYHNSFMEAQNEAIRLSQKHKGAEFLVFECVGSAITDQPTKWTPTQ